MRRLALSTVCLVLLAACETTGNVPQPPVGVSQTELEPGRLQVTYRGTNAMSEAEVRDRALLAAAEAALARGFDWFEIVGRSSDIAVTNSPTFSFGMGTGSYGRSGGVSMGASTTVGGPRGSHVSALEIVGGKGPKPDTPDAYDARSVSDTLRRGFPAG